MAHSSLETRGSGSGLGLAAVVSSNTNGGSVSDIAGLLNLSSLATRRAEAVGVFGSSKVDVSACFLSSSAIVISREDDGGYGA